MSEIIMHKDNLNIINLVPKFLNFYKLAVGADPQKRYELWKEHYGFAAVPPKAAGEQLARQLLNNAWDQYGDVLPTLEQWMPDKVKIERYLCEIKCILDYDDPLDFALVFFIGGFENNAFVAPMGEGGIAVCLPVENGNDDIATVHELAHVVHGKVSGFSMEWEKSVASLVLTEGLATQLSKYLVPACDETVYIEHIPGWLQQCAEDRANILHGIVPYLEDASSETVFRFTMGTGTTGKTREAYYAGWTLVGELLKHGFTFAQIARLQERDVAGLIACCIQ